MCTGAKEHNMFYHTDLPTMRREVGMHQELTSPQQRGSGRSRNSFRRNNTKANAVSTVERFMPTDSNRK